MPLTERPSHGVKQLRPDHLSTTAPADADRTCGTLVEGGLVGGDTRGGRRSLHDGDVIIVGSSRSPYAFKFRVG